MTALTPEMIVLGWSMILFLVHMAVQAAPALKERGAAFNAGPRDDPRPLSAVGGRCQRAFDNFKETWPLFIALALGLAITHRGGGTAATGAWIWLGGRIAYLPLYILGIPYLRSVAYGVAGVGLVMMAVRLF